MKEEAGALLGVCVSVERKDGTTSQEGDLNLLRLVTLHKMSVRYSPMSPGARVVQTVHGTALRAVTLGHLELA